MNYCGKKSVEENKSPNCNIFLLVEIMFPEKKFVGL
jgi:hypothetical protein